MITASNFDDQVLNQDIPTLVNFFAPWCGHCQELKPKWNESSNLLKGRAKLVSVDCTDDKNQSLVKELNIKGFPTIKVFSKGATSRNSGDDYSGPRDSRGIKDWVVNNLLKKGGRRRRRTKRKKKI